MIKRLIDISCAMVGLVTLSPILAISACLIWLSMGRPIFFKQIRPGLNCKPFELIKFRTMTNYTDKNGNLLPDSERLTKLGAILRKTSIDELPELFNVLKSEMSIVGPRPLSIKYLSRYSPEQMRRHKVKPGLTGLAQVHGRNSLAWENRFKHDVWYVDNYNIILDLKIIFKTFGVIFTDSANYAPYGDFMGSSANSISDDLGI